LPSCVAYKRPISCLAGCEHRTINRDCIASQTEIKKVAETRYFSASNNPQLALRMMPPKREGDNVSLPFFLLFGGKPRGEQFWPAARAVLNLHVICTHQVNIDKKETGEQSTVRPGDYPFMLPSPYHRGRSLPGILFCQGHLWVHFRYGPVTCLPSQGWLCRSASSASFPPLMRLKLQDSDSYLGVSAFH